MSKDLTIDRRTLLATAAIASAAIPTAAAMPEMSGKPGLSGKSILITGASSGFGRLGAEHYARLGAKVFATMRNLPRPEAEELKAIAESDDLDIHIIEIDVLSDEQVATGTQQAVEAAGGKIDVLVNNAGIGISGSIEVQDMEATKLIFDTNVFGYQRMIRALLPAMRAAGSGQIFNVSSQLGRVIVPGSGHYSPTKFAVEALSEAMAYELVPHGIDVTIIQPGGYPTEVWKNRNIYTGELAARSDDALLKAYPELTAGMGEEDGSGRSADPMDIPHAIAEIIAMPRGKRPLRRAVHPGMKPQTKINEVSAETQLAWLGNSGYGPWVKDVLSDD